MTRLLFEKVGDAVCISHLDLMRLFQRAFKRGGLNLKHTQGFSPRAMVSIALPLSVGVESVCEILDYELDGQTADHDLVVEKLNATMPRGIRVLRSYDSNYKIKNLAKLSCAVTLEYDRGIPEGCEAALAELYSRESLTVEKRGKNGPQQQDIIPMLFDIRVERLDGNTLALKCVVSAQNPSLNPMQLVAAIGSHIPEFAPDFAKVRREDVLFPDGTAFR